MERAALPPNLPAKWLSMLKCSCRLASSGEVLISQSIVLAFARSCASNSKSPSLRSWTALIEANKENIAGLEIFPEWYDLQILARIESGNGGSLPFNVADVNMLKSWLQGVLQK